MCYFTSRFFLKSCNSEIIFWFSLFLGVPKTCNLFFRIGPEKIGPGPPGNDPNQTKTKGSEKKPKKIKKHKHLLILSPPELQKCVILEIIQKTIK
jgi:hypothetical protein